jgi:DNA-3-methyladenine glycosylase I
VVLAVAGCIAARPSIPKRRTSSAATTTTPSLDTYLWGFVGGEPLVGRWRTLGEIPTETAESRAMSRDLNRRGFRFVGPTICYPFMQATGLVNDHVVSCFRFGECGSCTSTDGF